MTGQPEDWEFIRAIQRCLKSFNIAVEPETFAELGRINTAGELEAWVRMKLRATGDDLVPIHWWPADRAIATLIDKRIQDAVQAVIRSPEPVTGDSQLADLFPKSSRSEMWRKLSKTLDWELPELQPPQAAIWLCIALFACPYIVAWGMLASQIDESRGVANFLLRLAVVVVGYAGLFLTLAAAIAIVWRTFPRRSFPGELYRVHDLARTMPADYRRDLVDSLRVPKESRVWPVVRQIIAEELQLPVEEVTKETWLRSTNSRFARSA